MVIANGIVLDGWGGGRAINPITVIANGIVLDAWGGVFAINPF
jgi:hypothetical protein